MRQGTNKNYKQENKGGIGITIHISPILIEESNPLSNYVSNKS
jgi:hypothetical protein